MGIKLSTAPPLVALALSLPLLRAQVSNTVSLTVSQAVERAVRQYPSVPAAEEQVNAAIAGIRDARTNYLPSVDALSQFNRATRNNVFGLLLPQSVLPTISGPVLGTNSGKSVWGSAAGVLMSWEPFDFGRRRALVESAEAARTRAERVEQRTQFEVATTTAAAFLTLVASEQTVRAAQAAVDRAQALVRSVTVLTQAQLRPGADLSRANTELEAAQTQLLQSEQSVAVAKVAIAQYTGVDVGTVQATPGHLLDLPSELPAPAINLAQNPAAQEQQAVVQESQARSRILERTYRPTFRLQAGAYSRGTGALPDGSSPGSWNGLAPTYFNVAAGFTVNIPVMALPLIRAEQAQEAALGRSVCSGISEAQKTSTPNQISKKRSSAVSKAFCWSSGTTSPLWHVRDGYASATRGIEWNLVFFHRVWRQ